MTDQEWADLDKLLRNWWSQDWDADRSEAFRVALDRFPAPVVAAALGRLLESGGAFRPSAAEIVAAVLNSGKPRPQPDEAWGLIEQAVRRIRYSIYDERYHESFAEALAWLRTQDEVVAGWAARRGLCGDGSLGHEPILDPEIGGAVRRRLYDEYTENVGAAADRVARGLPPVDEAVFERALAGEFSMADLLERLRPAAQLVAGGEEAC